MKRLTKEEADQLPRRPDNRTSWFRGVVFSMKVGEIILLEPQDWKHKRSPITTLKQMTKKNGREWTCEMLLNGLGWVVERVK
ncbi:MAG: hypothetical protein K9J06_10840 [Flavobacteriales bacterium]|nr:hypothetical protein [Flavobacteriales bacterium]